MAVTTEDPHQDWGLNGDALARLMEWADTHNAEPNHHA